MPSPHQGRTAVYRFFNRENQLLYVGITSNPRQRWPVHSLKPWWLDVVTREVEWFDTRAEAEEVEGHVIYAERPIWNAQSGVGSRAPEVRSGGKGWRPSERMDALIVEFEAAQRHLAEARELLEAEAIGEMRAGVSANALAKQLPWSDQSLRNLARAANVPRLKEATVIGIREWERLYGGGAETAS